MSEREWRFYIRDMIGFVEKALAYTAGMDRAAFLQNALVFDATLRNIELIGSFTLILASTTMFCGASFTTIFQGSWWR